MGWLFGWRTRKELAEHLISGNGVKTLRHAWKGNNLWAVQEGQKTDGTTVRFIALYLCKGSRDKYDPCAWGYKDMDETAGPWYCNCPKSYLDMVEAPDPEMYPYSAEWRQRVREHHAKVAQKFRVGQKVRLYGRLYTITEVKPRGKYLLDGIYTSTPKHIRFMEVVA